MALTRKYRVYLTCTQNFNLGSLYKHMLVITRTKDTKLGGWACYVHKHYNYMVQYVVLSINISQ